LDENDEKKTTFFQVSPFQIIVEEDYIQDKVIGVENNKVYLLGGETIQARKAVIIAAGVWTDEILKTSGYKELGIDGVLG
jgi:glycerol-3-phosphate dehydrogenase